MKIPLDSVEHCAYSSFQVPMKEVGIMTSIGIRLSVQEKEMLAAIASRTDMTISQIVRKLIREYLGSVSQSETAPPTPEPTQASVWQQEWKRKEAAYEQ